MELRVLRYFLAVVREENILRAAEALHITQPSLSRQLAQLEDELGAKLFERRIKQHVGHSVEEASADGRGGYKIPKCTSYVHRAYENIENKH